MKDAYYPFLIANGKVALAQCQEHHALLSSNNIIKIVDWETAKHRIPGDESIIRELVKLLLEESPKRSSNTP